MMDTSPPQELRLVEMKTTHNCIAFNVPRNPPTGILSSMNGYSQELEYDASICFYICEEALRAGWFTGRGITCCSELADEAGKGQIGLGVCAPRYRSLARARTRS